MPQGHPLSFLCSRRKCRGMQDLFFPSSQKSLDCGSWWLVPIAAGLYHLSITDFNRAEGLFLFSNFPDKQDGTFPLYDIFYIASDTVMEILTFLQDLLRGTGKKHGKPIFYKMILPVHFLKLFLDLPVAQQTKVPISCTKTAN